MKILAWAVRLVIFLFLFAFAVQNTESVSLRFLLGQVWQAPLVIVLLVFFAGGALVGALSQLALIFGQRREIARLKNELNKPATPVAIEPPTSA
jgi:uncharacterized integral membrane protein